MSIAEIALPKNVDVKTVSEQMEVIAEELNVKKVEFFDVEKVSERVQQVLKPNAKLLGPKFGSLVQKIIAEAREGNFEEKDGQIVLPKLEVAPGQPVILAEGEYSLETSSAGGDGHLDAASSDGITVILNTEISEELLAEGYAREMVRAIQELRKEADFKVSDRIMVDIQTEKEMAAAVTKFADYIARETLANEIIQKGDLEGDKDITIEIDSHKVKITVKKSK